MLSNLNINPIQQNFTGSHFNYSKMNRAQKDLSNCLANELAECDQYICASGKKLGLCFFPAEGNAVKIRLLDSVSDSFVKNKKGKFIEVTSEGSEKSQKRAINKVLTALQKTINGEYAREPFDDIKVGENLTDLAIVHPTVYETTSDALKGVYNNKTLRNIAKQENDVLERSFEF